MTLRTVLITTGLRPIPLAFPHMPGNPTGVIVWDNASAFPGKGGEFLRKVKRTLTRKPYASLRDLCQQHDLHFAACDKNDAERLGEILTQWKTDLVITSGCAVIPMQALDNVPLAGINIHPSLLPAWRGANPLFWQLAAHDPQVGVTVHALSEKIDAGEILAQAAIDRPDGLSRPAFAQLLEGELGVPLVSDCIAQLQSSNASANNKLNENTERTQQLSSPTHYARAVKPHELKQQLPLEELHPGVVWNLLKYLGTAPADWIGISGWRKKFRWIAVDYRFDNDVNCAATDCSPGPGHNAVNTQISVTKTATKTATKAATEAATKAATADAQNAETWETKIQLFSIELHHPQGWIKLIPARLSWPYAIWHARHLKQMG